MTIIYVTEAGTGWKREIDLADMVDTLGANPCSLSTDHYGVSTTDLSGDDDLIFFSDPERNADGIEIRLLEQSIYLLNSQQEIEEGLAKGVTDFHMSDRVRQNMRQEFLRVEPEIMTPPWNGIVLVATGFGDETIIPLSVPLDIINTPRNFSDVLSDFAASRPIDGSRSTNAIHKAEQIIYLTGALDGVKLAVDVNDISEMIPRQAAPEDNGFFKVASAKGHGFGDVLLGFGNRFYATENEDMTEIVSSKGSIRVLERKTEIADALEKGISDLHMSKPVQTRQAIVFSAVSFEAETFYVVKGFGGPEVFPHDPFTTLRPNIETMGPRSSVEIRKDITNGNLIDGSRPTDILRKLERGMQRTNQKKLES